MDSLYINVVSKAVGGRQKNNEPLYRRLRAVVGAIILLRNPLGCQALATLLDMSIPNVFAVTHRLTAVLVIPDNLADPIRVFHPSFADFVLLRC
jgi:hypothetical protein